MKTDLLSVFEAAVLAGAVTMAACSSDSMSSSSGGNGMTGADAGRPATAADAGCPATGADAGCPAEPAPVAGDAQKPPIGTNVQINAWLAEGSYKSWTCESDKHAPRFPSSPTIHGTDRVCSNDLLSAHGAGEFPVGAAGVKELYDTAGANIIGYATYLKTAAGGAESWYWYETTNGAVVAKGLGNSGEAKSICVGCHAGAGSDAMHSGHDFVYTQVKQ